jgi:hypothetical protein
MMSRVNVYLVLQAELLKSNGGLDAIGCANGVERDISWSRHDRGVR